MKLPELSREERTFLLERAVTEAFASRGDPKTYDDQASFDVLVSLKLATSEAFAREGMSTICP